MLSTDSSDPRPRPAMGFQPGAPSANPTGRPTKLVRALRGLQPLARLGVLQDELRALAEAQAVGSPQCWSAALALIAGRLRIDPATLAEAAQPAGAVEGER